MSKRRAFRLIDWVALMMLLWAGLAAVPATWLWFSPGPVVISDSAESTPPVVDFERVIHRNTRMSYQVVIRRMATKEPVCDPQRGPFTYRTDASTPERIDLVWWSGADARCWPREPGTYIAETCWTVTQPFWGIVPPKTVCRTSNPFTIFPHPKR